MANVKKLSEIEASPIHRCLTGFDELDWICGNSQFPTHTEWGMPQGKISIWSGKTGTGKSRLCIDVAKRWSQKYAAGKILYILTEAPLGDFASWAKNTTDYPNIYCSSEDEIDKIIEAIYQVNPDLVFIDSVNAIRDFSGNEKSVTRLIKGADDKPGLKQAVNDIGGHIVLLGQLNQDGKTIKGGTSLPYMVDVALDIIPSSTAINNFIVKVGVKNRHGKKDAQTVFTHIDSGVINSCSNRLKDKFWRQAHGISEPISTGSYIGEDGQMTDIITPAMQARMDKCPDFVWTLDDKEPTTYEKIGNFLDRVING